MSPAGRRDLPRPRRETGALPGDLEAGQPRLGCGLALQDEKEVLDPLEADRVSCDSPDWTGPGSQVSDWTRSLLDLLDWRSLRADLLDFFSC